MNYIKYKQPVLGYIFYFLLFTGILNVHGQNSHFQFYNLTQNQDLNTSTITGILQDSLGFIWISTQDGLYRYDGYEFKVYRNIRGNDQTIAGNYVNRIFEDSHKNIWVSTFKGISLYDRNKDIFIHEPDWLNINVSDIYEDHEGYLYFGSYNGIYVVDKDHKDIKYYQQYPYNGVQSNDDHIFFPDSNQLFFVGHYGVNTFDYRTRKFGHLADLPSDYNTNQITYIIKDYNGTYWVATRGGGLFYMKSRTVNKTGKFTLDQFGLTNNGSVLSLMQDKDSLLWIGTENNGLFVLDLKKFYRGEIQVKHLIGNNTPGTICNNSIYSFYQDKQGTIWIGTYSGLCLYNPILSNFRNIVYTPGQENMLNNNLVNTFYEDGNKIWIGTEGGINIYNRITGKFDHLTHDPKNENSLSGDAVWAIDTDREGNFWIGTWGAGLNKYNPETGRFTHFLSKGGDTTSLSGNNIFSIITDEKGIMWIGTMGAGLDSYNPETGQFRRYQNNENDSFSLSNNWVRQVFLDTRGRLWVSNYSTLDLLDRNTGHFTHFVTSNTDTGSISDNGVEVIFEDSKGHMWFGTSTGLNLFNEKTRTFRKFTTEDSLPSNEIQSILEDNNGDLWIGTNDGISEFVHAIYLPARPKFINFDIQDGLQGNKFNRRSALKCKDGTMFFGGKNGLTVFNPSQIKQNTYQPPVVLTAFLLFNKAVSPENKKILGGRSINLAKQIVLKYRQSVFTIKFAALNYIIPQKNKYAYMLKGFDKSWIMAGNKREATYTNLDPGNYVFLVKASNNDGIWNNSPTTIKIRILPLWYQTLLFKILAVIFLLAATTGLFFYRLRSLRFQKANLEREVATRTKEISKKNTMLSRQADELNEVNIELEERNQQIEEQAEELKAQAEELKWTNDRLSTLNTTKDKFFSIIAHDLKNPFNTIIGFIDLLGANYNKWPSEKTSNIIGHISKATNTAYELLENLLTWSRAQQGTLLFEPETINVEEVMHKTINLVQDNAQKKNITIASTIRPKDPKVEADYNMLYTILRNLMTNAIKYTPKGGRIVISAEQENDDIIFKVSDNGMGMDPDTKRNLFKITLQRSQAGTENEQGTGLGLILCKEFADKHHGDISVESVPGKGSTFTVKLPVKLVTA